MIKDTVKTAATSNIGVVRMEGVGPQNLVFTNTVMTTFKEASARLLVGSTLWRPTHIGFMFGSVAEGDFEGSLSTPNAADTMTTVNEALNAICTSHPTKRNVVITPLASIPEIVVGASTTITFNGCTIPVTVDNILDAAGKRDFATGDYVYNVLLLTKPDNNYRLLARAEVTGFPVKTADRELAIYWQITLT